MTSSIPMLVCLCLCVACGAPHGLAPDAGPAHEDASTQTHVPFEPRAIPERERPTGLPCGSDHDCTQGLCRRDMQVAPEHLRAVPLLCGIPALHGAAPGAMCRTHETCARGLCSITGTCVRPCLHDSDCASGERCAEIYLAHEAEAHGTVQACIAARTLPADVHVNEEILHPEEGALFVNQRIAPSNQHRLILWNQIETTAPPMIYSVEERGERLFTASAARTSNGRFAIFPFTLSDFTTLALPPTQHALAVELMQLEGAAIRQLTLTREHAGNILDLDLFLVGGGGWRSDEGRMPRGLADTMQEVATVLTPAGIHIGQMRVHDVVGELRTRLGILEGRDGVLDTPSELAALFRLSAGLRRPSLPIFFIRMVDSTLLLGISGGIPGPQGMPGYGSSGIAIATDLTGDALSLVIAHEIGHFLGLMHTSEGRGHGGDPFDDTPHCGPERDTNGDRFLDPEECWGAGAENLMFWSPGGSQLSAQQRTQLQEAFILRAED